MEIQCGNVGAMVPKMNQRAYVCESMFSLSVYAGKDYCIQDVHVSSYSYYCFMPMPYYSE